MNAIKDQVGVLVDHELFFAGQKHTMFRSPHEDAAEVEKRPARKTDKMNER